VCQVQNGGSIDPSVFAAPDGRRFLIWKSDDNGIGEPTRIGAQELAADGLSLVGPRMRLLSATAHWQAGVIEGPSMFASGGRFYLFYGANHWDSSSAGIGYAVCDSPLGPCTNMSTVSPWLATSGAAIGPSGPDVFIGPDGSPRLAYHAWYSTSGVLRGRALWIAALTFAG
jgi:hypothetical protein